MNYGSITMSSAEAARMGDVGLNVPVKLSKEELRERAIAAGYTPDKRTFHSTLLNITRSGRLVFGEGNKYRPSTTGIQSLPLSNGGAVVNGSFMRRV